MGSRLQGLTLKVVTVLVGSWALVCLVSGWVWRDGIFRGALSSHESFQAIVSVARAKEQGTSASHLQSSGLGGAFLGTQRPCWATWHSFIRKAICCSFSAQLSQNHRRYLPRDLSDTFLSAPPLSPAENCGRSVG